MNDESPECPFPVPVPYPQPSIEPVKIFRLKSLREARFEKKCQTSRTFTYSCCKSFEESPQVNRKNFAFGNSIISRAKGKVREEEKVRKSIPHRVINLVKTPRRSLNF